MNPDKAQSQPATQNFFANWGADFRQEGYSTRSKPLTFLALLLSVTALAQMPGDENGTDQVETAEAAKTNWLEKNAITIGAVAALHHKDVM